jgi:hypothetical protein
VKINIHLGKHLNIGMVKHKYKREIPSSKKEKINKLVENTENIEIINTQED